MRVTVNMNKFPALTNMTKTAVLALIEKAIREFLESENGRTYCKMFNDTQKTEKISRRNND